MQGKQAKMGCVLLGGRGKLMRLAQRQKLVELIGEANTAGAGLLSPALRSGFVCTPSSAAGCPFWVKGDGKNHWESSLRLVLTI